MDPPREPSVLAYKARSAWQAARMVADVHPDSAASRAYCAVHHALRWRYGGDLPRGHGGAVGREVLAAVGLGDPESDAIGELYVTRRIADYGERMRVHRRDALRSVAVARALLDRLGIRTE